MKRKTVTDPVWARLPDGLMLPAPGIYVPQQGVPVGTRGMWGFEPILTRNAATAIPIATAGDQRLCVRIDGKVGATLCAVPQRAGWVATKPLACGRFATKHPASWLRAVHAAGALIVAIGPDEQPARTEGQELSDLWIFKAGIAVVPLLP